MKRISVILLLAISSLASTAGAGVRLNFDFFYDSLAPYGEWVSVGEYGNVWHPADVDDDWTPYSDGYWAYTDAGWTWVSYEDWGGITYHYGRWARLNDYGWCWVPGDEWGPAWVSWRRSDDYVGWAPLPPEACWRHDTGFGIWVDTEFDIGPGCFRFCHARDFGAPFLRPVLLPCAQNITIIEQTINITNITYRRDRGHAFNGGPDYGWVSPRSARPVPTLKLIRNTDDIFVRGSRGKVFRNAPSGNTLVMAAPPVLAGALEGKGRQRPVARSLTNARIDRGWAGAANDPARDRIRAKFKQQTADASPKTAPARPFQSGLVAMVPKKSDPTARLALTAPVATTPAPPAAPAEPGTGPVAGKGRPNGSIPSEPPTVTDRPSIAAESGDKDAGRKSSKTRSHTQPLPPVTQSQPSTPKIVAEPGSDPVAGKSRKHAVIPQSVPPSGVGAPTVPRNAPAPGVEPKREKPFQIPGPQPGRSKHENAARIADEQADVAARRRDAEAARILDQQRAAGDARRQAEVQRAAEAQRRQSELGARRAVEEGRQRQMEMLRQQQAAAEAARRQAAAARVPVPPPPAPAAVPPRLNRPDPSASPESQPGDPRKRKGKGGEPKD